MEKHFCCRATEVLPGIEIISTNDKVHYSSLIALGGKTLCSPALFNSFSGQEADMPIPLSQTIPYVVLVQRQDDRSGRSSPAGDYEGYETRLYR